MKKETEKKLLKIVKENYEEIARQFSETRKKEIWPELKKICKNIPEESNILDLGCGNGRLIEAFEKNINYIGVDQSEALIKMAKERYPDNSFIVGDALNLNQINFKANNSTNKFNYIFSIAVLQHIPNEKRRIELAKSLKNFLQPQGKVIISVWNMWEINKFRKLIFKTYLLKLLRKNEFDFGDVVFDWKNSTGTSVSKRYYHAFTKKELKSIFSKAGFRVETIYKDKFNYYLVASI